LSELTRENIFRKCFEDGNIFRKICNVSAV
jgi:hypothetical protein